MNYCKVEENFEKKLKNKLNLRNHKFNYFKNTKIKYNQLISKNNYFNEFNQMKQNTAQNSAKLNLLSDYNKTSETNIKLNQTLKNFNNSIFYDENLSLVKNSSLFRHKIEKLQYEYDKSHKSMQLNNQNQNWCLSLRRNKNFMGKRCALINIKDEKKPVWYNYTEQCPLVREHIYNKTC